MAAANAGLIAAKREAFPGYLFDQHGIWDMDTFKLKATVEKTSILAQYDKWWEEQNTLEVDPPPAKRGRVGP
jgi:hypothetical protein